MDLSALIQLGIAGPALFIMWKMYDANTKERDRYHQSSTLEREKFLSQINETHKEFGLFQEKVRTEIMAQLSKNTSAFEKVLDHFK